MCDTLDKLVIDRNFFHYLGKGNWFYYQDISNFWYTIVNYSEHVIVMICVTVILNNRHSEIIHNTIFIIVAHLNSGAFVRKCIVNYSYCDFTAFSYI